MKYFLILISVLLSDIIMGQSVTTTSRPIWWDSPLIEGRCSAVRFVKVKDNSSEKVREKAVKMVFGNGLSDTSGEISIQGSRIVWRNGDEIKNARIIAEHTEETTLGEVTLGMLVQVPKYNNVLFEEVRITDRYPFSPRVFVPGMEQIYKGSVTKGVLFIAGETATGIGIAVFECLRYSKKSELRNTHDLARRRKYLNEADRMRTWRNGFIAGAVVIYLWNIIDGCVAKGEERVWIKKCKMGIRPHGTGSGAELTFGLNF